VRQAILDRITNDDPDGARLLLDGVDAVLSSAARAEWRYRVAWSYYITNRDPQALAIARKHGWQFDIMSTSFFLSRRALKPSAKSGMPSWQDHLFIALARSASDATDFFQIPTGRVVEVGTQVTV